MDLVGAARRLGVPARSKELRGQQRVLVRDPDAINTLLSAMGVREMLTRWYQPPTRTGGPSVEAFGESNVRRAQAAAEQACAVVQETTQRNSTQVRWRSSDRGVQPDGSPLPRASAAVSPGSGAITDSRKKSKYPTSTDAVESCRSVGAGKARDTRSR